jgi:Ca2+ transporting ATPase
MDDAFTKPWEDVTEYFRVDPERGLAMEQVRSYQEKYGPNGEKL